MENTKIRRSISLFAPIQNASVNKQLFTDIQLLRNKRWLGIESFTIGQVSKGTNGLNNVPDANFESAYITLQDSKGNAIIQQMPVTSFNSELNGGRWKELTLQDIDIPNSFVEIFNPAGLTTSMTMIFNVFWEEIKD